MKAKEPSPLAGALAGYTKARWPEAFSVPIDFGDPPGHTRQLQIPIGKYFHLLIEFVPQDIQCRSVGRNLSRELQIQ